MKRRAFENENEKWPALSLVNYHETRLRIITLIVNAAFFFGKRYFNLKFYKYSLCICGVPAENEKLKCDVIVNCLAGLIMFKHLLISPNLVLASTLPLFYQMDHDMTLKIKN